MSSDSSAEVPAASQSTWDVIVSKLKAAWHWFDVNVGGWLGLDTPKYEMYIDEHKRLLQEEEVAVHAGSLHDQQVSRDLDNMEGGPPASVLFANPASQRPYKTETFSDIGK